MLVIDSSVFASVIVKDEFHEVSKGYMLADKATVDIAFAEAGNVLWKHVRMGRIKRREAGKRVRLLMALIESSEVYRSADLLSSALEMAVEIGITVYDSLFLSLAVELDTSLVTADRELYERLPDSLRERIVLLG